MNVYQIHNLQDLLKGNAYPGRGIVIGQTEDGTKSVVVYFIMGRSPNSRNRVFVEKEGEVRTKAFDPSKLEDPSLIIYSPVRSVKGHLIVTNGDQTDTIYDAILEGKSFEDALSTREFEPDAPNFTPRISGIVYPDKKYSLSILKSTTPEGSACVRQFFSYPFLPGLGHFIHTYHGDGNPLPTFIGEPKRVAIPNEIEPFAEDVWTSLHPENKISLYVRFDDLNTGKSDYILYNKNMGEEGRQ